MKFILFSVALDLIDNLTEMCIMKYQIATEFQAAQPNFSQQDKLLHFKPGFISDILQ